ncbi:MAG: hypothetical protein WAX89_00920 [Alphaproteobacteria bacterium]
MPAHIADILAVEHAAGKRIGLLVDDEHGRHIPAFIDFVQSHDVVVQLKRPADIQTFLLHVQQAGLMSQLNISWDNDLGVQNGINEEAREVLKWMRDRVLQCSYVVDDATLLAEKLDMPKSMQVHSQNNQAAKEMRSIVNDMESAIAQRDREI